MYGPSPLFIVPPIFGQIGIDRIYTGCSREQSIVDNRTCGAVPHELHRVFKLFGVHGGGLGKGIHIHVGQVIVFKECADDHYKALFPQNDVFGLDYHAQTPWEAKREFPTLFHRVCEGYRSVVLIANSIGAFFAMNALYEENIERAFFISPVVNMEKLICNMMLWSNVTENDLREKKEIETDLGETLSWAYLCYVRENPLVWTVPTAT